MREREREPPKLCKLLVADFGISQNHLLPGPQNLGWPHKLSAASGKINIVLYMRHPGWWDKDASGYHGPAKSGRKRLTTETFGQTGICRLSGWVVSCLLGRSFVCASRNRTASSSGPLLRPIAPRLLLLHS